MKAVLIARVSTEEQRDAGNSLPAQVARLERYCQSRGLEIMRICSFDESVYKGQRDEFDRIIDFVLTQPEKIAICCDKVDRISRNIFDVRISKLYEKAINDELELHFVSDGQVLNSKISAVEKFQFSISLGLAKYYSDAISDNVKRAQEQKIRKGEWLSKAPYGYKNINLSGNATDIIVDEYQAEIVRRVYELYATSAFSMETLNCKIKVDFNVHWLKCTLARVLSNPFYYGEMLFKGQTYPHRYPPVISRTLYEQVKKVRTQYQKRQAQFAGPLPYMYRGLIRCATCDSTITPEKQKNFVYYHCTQFKGKHNAKYLREEEITRQLCEMFQSLQVPDDILKQVTATLNKVHQDKIEFHNQQIEHLSREQKKLTSMIDNLYMDKLKGCITESSYDRFYQDLRAQLADVQNRLARLQEAEDNYYISTKHLLELTKHAHDLFVRSEIDEKRQLIKLVLSNLTLNGEKLVFEPHKPLDLILNCTDRIIWRG